jgi:hypothetical protein
VLKLRDKYADVPMSLADACPVRMTGTLADPVVVTPRSFRFRSPKDSVGELIS